MVGFLDAPVDTRSRSTVSDSRRRRASARSFQRTPDAKHSRQFVAGRRTEKADFPGDGVAIKTMSAVTAVSGAACISFILDPNPLIQPGFCQ